MRYFSDRVDAGKRLTEVLADIVDKNAIILAIPRGGVVIGFEIACALDLPLDIIVPRKIGAPENPELAIGAMTQDGTVILDDKLVKYLGVSEDYINSESERQKLEIERRLRLYRGDTIQASLKDREVIIVDDGIATGSTMKAALASVLKSGAKKVIVAIPVGPPSTIAELESQGAQVVCPYTPEPFYAIAEFYGDFAQTDDNEVIELLKQTRRA
jgi:putative phosphoribosyl transferase